MDLTTAAPATATMMSPTNMALIIGCSLGGAILIIVIFLLIVCCKLRARERKKPENLKSKEEEEKFDYTNYALNKSSMPTVTPDMQYPPYLPQQITPWSNYKSGPSSIVLPPLPAFEPTKVLPASNRNTSANSHNTSDTSSVIRTNNPYSSLPVLPRTLAYGPPSRLPRQDSYPPNNRSQVLETHVHVNKLDTRTGNDYRNEQNSDLPIGPQTSDGFSSATAFVAPVHQTTSSIGVNEDGYGKSSRVVSTAGTVDFELDATDNIDDVDDSKPASRATTTTSPRTSSTQISGNPFVAKVQVTRGGPRQQLTSSEATSDIVARAYSNYSSNKELSSGGPEPIAVNRFTSMDNLRYGGVPIQAGAARLNTPWQKPRPDIPKKPATFNPSLEQSSVVTSGDTDRPWSRERSETIVEEEETTATGFGELKNERRPKSMYPPQLMPDEGPTGGNQIMVQAVIERQPKERNSRVNRQSVGLTDDIGDAFKFLDEFEE